jgi:hypothetical protein
MSVICEFNPSFSSDGRLIALHPMWLAGMALDLQIISIPG